MPVASPGLVGSLERELGLGLVLELVPVLVLVQALDQVEAYVVVSRVAVALELLFQPYGPDAGFLLEAFSRPLRLVSIL